MISVNSSARNRPFSARTGAFATGNRQPDRAFNTRQKTVWRLEMGRGLLLWLIGIPLPIILVIWLFGGLS